MTKYAKHVSKKATIQRQPARKEQVKNSAGGYTFALDKFDQLMRFLVLGSESNTYYASSRNLTIKNAKVVEACLDEAGRATVDVIVQVSKTGRAPKNDPAIFALAMACAHKDEKTRKYALSKLSDVCRTSTHLFQFLNSVKEMRGWGRALRKAVCDWYISKSAKDMAYQMVKYRSREGWTHRDVLRLAGGSMPKHSKAQETVLRWAVNGPQALTGKDRLVKRGETVLKYEGVTAEDLPKIIEGFEKAKSAELRELPKLISDYKLTREMIPNTALSSPAVWEALLVDMPITATIRNLGKMTEVGVIKPLSGASKLVVERLTNQKRLGRVHPLAVLVALNTYKGGKGIRGSLTWSPVPAVVDALDEAYYLAFGNIVPTGKNIMLALDVSGSMGWGDIAGLPGITPKVGAAAMAMAIARTEKNYQMVAFTSSTSRIVIPTRGFSAYNHRRENGLTELDITSKQRLDTVIKKTQSLPFGGTDCSLPMLYATQKQLDVDAFVVITDNETWAGRIHPFQALKRYRKASGKPNAKCAVVGMTATNFTIADPSDPNMLDVVGFDTAAPQFISDFISEDLTGA